MPPDAHLDRWRNAALSALSLGSAAALLVVGLPRVLHVGWVEIGRSLAEVPADVLASLVGLWLAGLCAYTVVTCAALPGLTRPRAFALNAVGGATSNLLPFGGTAGAVLGYAMARSWEHGQHFMLTATVVVNTYNVAQTAPAAGDRSGGAAAHRSSGQPSSSSPPPSRRGHLLVVALGVGARSCRRVASPRPSGRRARHRRAVAPAPTGSGRTPSGESRAAPAPDAGQGQHRAQIARRFGLGTERHPFALPATLFSPCLPAVSAHAPPTMALAAYATETHADRRGAHSPTGSG